MFGKLQTAAIAAFFATSALAMTYAPDAVLITVTVTNTKTWCPCESTGLGGWGGWPVSTGTGPNGWVGTTTTTSLPGVPTTITITYPYQNGTTTTVITTVTDPGVNRTTNVIPTPIVNSTTIVPTPYQNSTTTTPTSTPTPTPSPACSLVTWVPGQCQDDSYFVLNNEYLYQSCNKALIDTPNYLENWIEAFCDVTSLFDDTYRATAWDPSTSRCYVYGVDDAVVPSSFANSPIVGNGTVDYTVKFDTNPCPGSGNATLAPVTGNFTVGGGIGK